MSPAPLIWHAQVPVYAWTLAALAALFLLRVLGQLWVALRSPSWLPAMDRWYSGLMPYRYLLPSQLAILCAMGLVQASPARLAASGWIGSAVAQGLLWLSYLYAVAMSARLIRWVFLRPEARGVLIPIPFHFVLAAYLFVFASSQSG